MTSNAKWLRTAIYIGLTALLALILQGCMQRHATQLASHKITVARHGFTSRFGVEEHNRVAIFRYRGTGTTGKAYDVTIQNDQITVNGQNLGTIREGDSVNISDDGITVNAMDYGETERYLRSNAAKASDAIRDRTGV